MTSSLYNCRSSPSETTITKFDDDLNPIASYIVSRDACDCPAGHQPSCRHRKMLKRFLAANAIDAHAFHDYEHNTWFDGEGKPILGPKPVEIVTASVAVPEGVTMIGLGDPELLHNTIADALGEPRDPPQPTPKPTTVRISRRGF